MANEFKVKNGLIVSGSADFEQDLRVRGTLTVDELHTSITSSSILYESGSTKLGNDLGDTHELTGSVMITGSITLNGEPIGTGKLDETVFNEYTTSYKVATTDFNNLSSSYSSFTSSFINISSSFDSRINNLETFSSSLDSSFVSEIEFGSFSSSINTYTSSLNSFTSSTENRLNNIENSTSSLNSFSNSLNSYTSSTDGRLSSLETESGSIRNTFNSFTSSYTTVSGSIDSRLDVLEAYSSSQQVPTSSYSFYTVTASYVETYNNVATIYEEVFTGEAIVKGDPLYISGSEGSKPKVYKADAAVPSKMPVVYIASQTIGANNDTNGIILGRIDGMNLNGLESGQEVYVAEGGGWSTSKPTGLNSITQLLGVVTKGGNGGKGLVLNPGPAMLPGLDNNKLWIGSTNNQAVEKTVNEIGLATTGSNLFIGTQTISGSIIPSVDNTYDLGSPTYQWRDVYISSGSLYIDGTKVISSTSQELLVTTDTGQSIKILEGGTDSIILQTTDGDVELKSSGDGDILLDPTTGKILLKGTVELLSGNKIQSSIGGTPVVFAGDVVVSGSIDITGTIEGIDLTQFSSSVNTRLSNLESSTGSLNSFTSSTNSRLNSIESTTSSLSSSIGSLSSSVATTTSDLSGSIGSLSSSVATTTSNLSSSMSSLSSSFSSTDNLHETRLNTIEGRYATTGSNTFIGDQIVTGSLYISQNLIVQGSSSLENITASAVSIGTNTIILNTDSPAVRYAGISVFDSGSTNVTASLFYDSLTNNWKFQHNDVGTDDASIVIFGPLGNGIDNAPLLDGNYLTKVENNGHGHHITTSSIFDNGSKISLKNDTEITGSLTVTGTIVSNATTLVSGSSQIVYSGISNIPSGIVSGSSQITSLLPNGVVSGSSQVSFNGISDKPTLVSGSSQISFNGITDKPTLVSGSSQITYSGLSGVPSGIISGSVQVDLTATTNYVSGIKTRLNAENVLSSSAQVVSSLPAGTVSGSSQISYGSISGIPSGIVSGSSQISFGSISGLPSGLVSGSSQISINGTNGFTTYLDQPVKSGSTVTFAGATFTAQGSASSGTINLQSADSFIRLNTTGGTTDKQKWDLRAISASGSESFEIRTINDANNVFSSKFMIYHSGTVRLNNYTTNGFVKFSNSDGTLTVDTNTYQTVGSTFYVGTTAIANNRSSASQTLTGVNIDGYSTSLASYGNQTIYTILSPNGNINGPVIKVRYDSATANRYIDIGSIDGNGTYTEGLKIYNGGTLTMNGNAVLLASNYSSYALPLSGGTMTGAIILGSSVPIRDSASEWILGKNSTNIDLGSTAITNGIRFQSASDSTFTYRGNTILHAGNYTTYTLDKTRFLNRKYTLPSGGGNISWNRSTGTLSGTQRLIWIPVGDSGGEHINLEGTSGGSDGWSITGITDWSIVYIRAQDSWFTSDARTSVLPSGVSITSYPTYVPDENDLVIGVLNGESGNYAFYTSWGQVIADNSSLSAPKTTIGGYTYLTSNNYGSYALPLTGGQLNGLVSFSDNAYFTGAPSHGFRWNSSNNAYNNVIMRDNGNVEIRGSVIAGSVGSAPQATLQVVGNMRWSTGGNSYYTYSDMDGNGLYIETVDNNTGRGKMRFQTRVNNSGSYSSYQIDANNSQHLWVINGNTRLTMDTSGHLTPGGNGTQNLGSSSLRWNTVFTSDLSMSNGIGDYTIVEGEEDLFIYNNKNNKVYKFLLQEVDSSIVPPKKI